MAPNAPQTAKRLRVAHLWLLVPLVGLTELGLHFYFAGRAPSVDEWRELRPAVAALRTRDEVIFTAPEWTNPLARHAFGDDLMPVEQVARSDDAAVEHAIEVSILGGTTSALSPWRETAREKHGKFLLRSLSNPKPERKLFDFVEHLAPEHASLQDGAGKSCPHTLSARVTTGGLFGPPAAPGVRFSCSGTFAGVTVIDAEEYRARRCIWLSPPPAGAVTLRYRDVPLARRLVVHTGMPWVMVRDGIGARVFLDVSLSGKPLGTAEHPEGTPWFRVDLETGKTTGERGAVDFTVRAEGGRPPVFCFAADLRE